MGDPRHHQRITNTELSLDDQMASAAVVPRGPHQSWQVTEKGLYGRRQKTRLDLSDTKVVKLSTPSTTTIAAWTSISTKSKLYQLGGFEV